MLTLILGAILLAAKSWLFVFTCAKVGNQGLYECWELGAIFSGIGLVAVVAIFIGILISQYADSIHLPLRLIALNRTIEQQSVYVTTGEGTVPQGLEGMTIKREIQETIRDRNELIADIKYRQISQWYLFKPNLTASD